MKLTTVYTVCTLLLIIDGTDGLLLSLNKNMTKSSKFAGDVNVFGTGTADKAVDGIKDRNTNVCKCCAATGHTFNTWFRLDLGKDFIIQHLEILGREEPPGPNLYHCVDGRFGDDCDTICHCKEGPCNKTTGICPAGGCKSGYFGESCPTECPDGKFGEDCTESCGYCSNNDPCDKKTGNCTSCAPGYENDLICKTECQDGTYGEACGFNCSGNCLGGVPCNKVTGSCDLCAAGFMESKCDVECPEGYFDLNCTRRCYCTEGDVCNKTTGTCPGLCAPGYIGPACESECEQGSYGQNCSNACGMCINNETCNHTDGTCTECAPGYLTDHCNLTCQSGYFGSDCSEQCGECRDEHHCPFTDGVCSKGCDRGYRNSTCKQECDNGTFGYNCDTTCGSCKDDEICNKTHGTCPLGCKPGYKPDTCLEECNDGTFGENCASTCGTCLNNSPCNETTGLCDEGCGAGYNGTFCNNICPAGTYGLDCNETCSEHCANGTVCDFKTGHCGLEGCGPGYTSENCKTECDGQSYGKNCINTCGRCTSGTCNKMNGYCDACLDGLVLPLCKAPPVGNDFADDKSNAEIWPVIVGVIGSVTGITTICILIFVYIKRRRNNQMNRNSSGILDNRQRTKISYNAENSTDNMIKIDSEDPVKYHKEMKTKENADVKQTGMYINVSFSHVAKQNAKVQMSDSISAHQSGLKICKLWNYIVDMKTNNCKKFYQEFELLQTGPLHLHKMALQYPSQNRYRGIYAYDHNRVPLTVDKPDESEYINASFINGFDKEKKFIACQGPSRETAKQFWQMIWQYNCKQILILTNLVETGKDKYAKYWAEEHEVTFGSITIKPRTFERMKDYDIRTFRISKNGKPAQSVTQYHFKAWQDKDVPDSPWSLVSFWLRVTKDMVVKADVGPVVVHCSAGVGRTGLFIALDFLYNQGKTDGCLTPFQAVAALRDQRPFMVQTKEQYVFLHEAVAESLLLGTHDILVDQIQDVYNYLSENDPVTNLSRMYMQFQLIIDSTENYENDGVYANDNEYFDMDMGMQHITSDETSFTQNLGTVLTTDYKGKQSFIIAPIPNSATMEMFWSLVRDKNIKTVVIVTDTTSPNYKQYLSRVGKKETDCSPVSMLEEKTTCHYTERQFQYTGKKVARGTVRLIEYTKWTDSRDVPDDRGSMVALLDHVLGCQECCSDKEPILILCTTGHLKSGVICALLNEFYRIKNDRGHINMIETVKLLKEKERLAIKSFEQYQYIYDVLLAKVCGEKLYENM